MAVLAPATVAVVITTYNHARFLGDAIDSVLAQTRRADELVVVDDGSSDDPQRVTGIYGEVRLIHQVNQGLAAARNTGLSAVKSEAVVFLDADDRLLPGAIAAGLRCFAEAPRSGFVYGGHRRISAGGRLISDHHYQAIGSDPYETFLRGNAVGMHASVMYRRDCLVAAGGFDPSLPRCEDYDVYLRMAQRYPITSYSEPVAEYRRHEDNVSRRHRQMLHWVLSVQGRQRSQASSNPKTARAWRHGRAVWRDYYCGEMLTTAKTAWRQTGTIRKTLPALVDAFAADPGRVMRGAFRIAKRRLTKPSIANPTPRRGSVRFGDLDRLQPISHDFGFARGTPIDRYFIEDFLARHQSDIRGRVLEIGDDGYTRRFGGNRVEQSDILHVNEGHPNATITGDLASPGVLPADGFDCLIVTQTLHLIYDMSSAVRQMYRALKPGGVALVTMPGITPIDRGEWKESWYWSLTARSARRLFCQAFADEAVSVQSYGNVFAATAFLHGIALEEVDRKKLDYCDDAYPVIVAVRARRRPDIEGRDAE
ncbi:MAG: glycosyltransferase [Hyphomicrobiales bacterium]|nr:glycosyltransferase [Hyphomicrobiales bacterium]